MKWSFGAALVILAALSFGRPALAAVDGYLKIDGIDGESQDDQHKDWIEISSYNEGANAGGGSGGVRGSGAGRSGGAPTIHQITITKRQDKATPLLVKYCAKGTHIPKVVLHLYDAKTRQYLVYTLENVFLSNDSVSSGGDRPSETLTLNFSRIQVDYHSQGENPQPEGTRQSGETRGMIPRSTHLPPPGSAN